MLTLQRFYIISDMKNALYMRHAGNPNAAHVSCRTGLGSPLRRAPRPTTFSPVPPVPPVCERNKRLVLARGAHCSDGSTEVAAAVVGHVVVVRMEVEAPRADRVAGAERT